MNLREFLELNGVKLPVKSQTDSLMAKGYNMGLMDVLSIELPDNLVVKEE